MATFECQYLSTARAKLTTRQTRAYNAFADEARIPHYMIGFTTSQTSVCDTPQITVSDLCSYEIILMGAGPHFIVPGIRGGCYAAAQ